MSTPWSVGCGHPDTPLASKAEIKVQVTKAPTKPNRAPMATIFSASNLGQAPRNASLHHTRPLPGSISFDNAEIASQKCKKLLQFTSNFAILGVKEKSI